ncbi:hypothetical protein [Vibrio alfacsensis]|uniref:hypothetical protein n=1 Tax=Vibrio alfacsensis TaxID=1074311 RepID=UPI001BF14D19|nr:hypothetical protein [Vibrio alfacsensis]BCN26789.1 hypothetical protein VYA_39810 [Vibrio alfacsensis]
MELKQQLTQAFSYSALLFSVNTSAGLIYDEDVDGQIVSGQTFELGLGENSITGDSCWIGLLSCFDPAWRLMLPEDTYISSVSYSWANIELAGDPLTTSWSGNFILYDGFLSVGIFDYTNWLEGGDYTKSIDEDALDFSGVLFFGYDAGRNGSGGEWDFDASFTVSPIASVDVPESSVLGLWALVLAGLAFRKGKGNIELPHP